MTRVVIENDDLLEDSDYDIKTIQSILTEFAKKLKRKIILHDVDDDIEEHPLPIEDKIIHIFPYATASYNRKNARQYELFGIKLNHYSSQSIVPNDVKFIEKIGGIELRDDKGILFGEAYGKNNFNNFYIHNDIFSDFEDSNLTIFKKMLNLYFGLISDKAKLGELSASLQENDRKMLAEARKNYAEAVSKRPEQEKNTIIKKMGEKEKTIKKLSLMISNTYRSHEELKAKLNQLEEIKDVGYEKYSEEFDLLKSHSSVDNGRVYVRDNKLDVFTKKVIIRDRGINYNIGKFLVSIDLKENKFECFNLDRNPEGHHHPHIAGASTDGFGDICFGSMAINEIKKYISHHQLAMAFHRIWCRLNIYTENDSMIDIKKFPEIKSRKKKETKR